MRPGCHRALAIATTAAAATVGLAILPGPAQADPAVPAYAYSVGAPIDVGVGPYAAAIDPGTATVYVANVNGKSVSVIDEAGGAVTATIGLSFDPVGIAVDPGTHTVYVTHDGDDSVSVINPAGGAVTATIGVGRDPRGIAVDPGTHTVYVANRVDNSVSVIDEAGGAVTATIGVGRDPMAIAVDPGTHTVYVANFSDDSVSVIDGARGAVTATIGVGDGPVGVAVDPVTHTVYVANVGTLFVSVIDGASATVKATIGVGGQPQGVAVDPRTQTVYVTNVADDSVSVIDETSGTVTDTIRAPDGTYPIDVQVDPGTHTAYVLNRNGNTVSPIRQVQQQSIRFTSSPPVNPLRGGSSPISAAGGGSGNPVTFSIDASSAPGACTVSDRGDSTATVSFTGLGACVIDADQAGGPGAGGAPAYAAAPRAQLSLTVGPAGLDHLVLTPSPASIAAGAAQSYVATGYSRSGADLGPVTSATTFSIGPDGSCAGSSCSATITGPHTVTGTAGALTATAPLTVTAGPPALVVPISGDAQASPAGQAFALPVVAVVADRYGNNAPGVPVTFTVTSGSATFAGGASATVVTDGSGRATSPTLTAGNGVGPVTVTLSSGAASSSSVTETVVEPGPARADMGVVLSGGTVPAGVPFTVRVTIVNQGPLTAGPILTTVVVPRGFTIGDAGGGTRYGSSLLFSLPAGLAPRAGLTYFITLTGTRVTGASGAAVRASVVSVTRDPHLRDNLAAATIRVT